MDGIKVEVDLNALTFGTRYGEDGEPIASLSLVDVVLDHVAAQLFKEFRSEAAKSEDSWSGLRGRIQAIRDEEIREAVRPAIQEALTAAIQPTNAYGEARGNPVTLREQIVKTATEWLTKAETDHYSRNKGKNPVQTWIAEEVQKAFTAELKQAMDAAKAEVLAAVQAEASAVLSKTIASMAGVR